MKLYEWDLETADEHGDLEHCHADRLADLEQPAEDQQLVLVLDQYLDGYLARQWAYVENGELPIEFDGGAPIPLRFVKELERFNASV